MDCVYLIYILLEIERTSKPSYKELGLKVGWVDFNPSKHYLWIGIMDWMFSPPNSYVEVVNHNVMVLVGRAFGR